MSHSGNYRNAFHQYKISSQKPVLYFYSGKQMAHMVAILLNYSIYSGTD